MKQNMQQQQHASMYIVIEYSNAIHLQPPS